MSNVFVFSTRYLGEGYAFSCRQDLAPTSKVREYLKSKLWCEAPSDSTEVKDLKNVWVLYNRHKEDMKVFFDSKGKEFQDRLIDPNSLKFVLKDKDYFSLFISYLEEKKSVVDFEKELSSCAGNNAEEKFDSRFSYYTLKTCNQHTDANVFAVPHLNWEADSRWLQCLIEDFGKNVAQDEKLYLIMHDNDVPNYAHTPYKLLTEDERGNLDLPKSKQFSKEKMSVIVYQHSSNDVVDILKNQNVLEAQVSDRIISISTIQGVLESIFRDGLKDKEVTKAELSKIPVCCSVDLNDQIVTENDKLVFDNDGMEKLASGRSFYTFTDKKGSLLNELMHVRMAISSAKRFSRFVEKLREPGLEPGKKGKGNAKKAVVDIRKFSFPLIIKAYKSFFDDWAEAVPANKDEILVHRNKIAMEENLERVFSFFNNSSIWVRLVDMYDEEALKNAVAEFEYFDNIGLYDYDSAWENLEYNLRIFTENFLETSLDGHGNYVTPMQYGDEVEARKILVGNSFQKL